MKMRFSSIILLLVLISACSNEKNECDALFVHDASGMEYDGESLRLKDANPNLIFFCDRPVRTAGHISREALLKLGTQGENSFVKNHPNAAISVFDSNNNIIQAVVEISSEPIIQGADIIYPVKLITLK